MLRTTLVCHLLIETALTTVQGVRVTFPWEGWLYDGSSRKCRYVNSLFRDIWENAVLRPDNRIGVN